MSTLYKDTVKPSRINSLYTIGKKEPWKSWRLTEMYLLGVEYQCSQTVLCGSSATQ